MPPYKRQHYLPCAYLKYFSIDQTRCDRDSKVWRFDGERQIPVSVISQGAADYHFSRSNPAETERKFQVAEDAYCRCVDKVKLGKKLTGQEYGTLLVMIFEFHLRNAAHENLTGKEGIEAYNIRSRTFLPKVLLGRETASAAEIIGHVERYWSIQIFEITSGSSFLTSDHPAEWISITRHKPGVQLAVLPLTPRHIAVGYDKRICEVRPGSLTPADERTLNAAQLASAIRCVYTSAPLSEEQMEIIKLHFARHSDSRCEVHEDHWKLKIHGIFDEHLFSFVRKTPPLM